MRLTRLLHILAIALALSAYAAWLRSDRAHQPDRAPPSDTAIAGIPLLRLDQAESLWHESSTLFLDVRSSVDYEYGHIEGALSAPEEEFDERLPALRPRLERAGSIVVYCKSVDCARSLWVALRLRGAGFVQTRIYPHGWNEWSQHELPVTRNAVR